MTMLKWEEIPDEVVDALWEANGDEHIGILQWRQEAKKTIAVVLNAWMNMDIIPSSEGGRSIQIALPLIKK
jgi:hypothetical protein